MRIRFFAALTGSALEVAFRGCQESGVADAEGGLRFMGRISGGEMRALAGPFSPGDRHGPISGVEPLAVLSPNTHLVGRGVALHASV